VPENTEKSVDELVREVRSQAYADSKDGTKHPCKTMRMLRVNYPVPVDGIYVKLNVLNRISGDFSSSDWQRNFQSNPSNFDRWGLGTVNQSQVSALSMVQKSSRLMVLGKPGSGKTTFLKSLLVECVEGRLRWNQQDYVPIFITLKDFAKASQKQLQSNLSNYIYQEFCSWGLRDSLKERQVVEKIFAEGRALILLDGLDEVPEEIDEKSQELDQESVIKEILNFSKTNNRIVITCRISQKYMWEGFTDVEIADFEKEEREEFVKKWFAVVNGNGESDKLAEQLIWQLQEPKNQQIAQLAVTPILLNLICIRFRDGDGKLPKNRADFYEDGVTILLKEWDATKPAKGVKRKTVHNSLKGIDDKKKLLAKVAAILFEQNDYFPKQEKLKELISKELDIYLSEAEEVIKSFEEQSGLLVERSKGVGSFSHLTFQEYFTAKWFCDRADWEGLVSHILDKRWREVFLLTVEITESADDLVRLMKKQIDEMVNTEKLQDCLKWLEKKAYSVSQKVPSKRAAIRAYYFFLSIAFDRAMTLESAVSFNLVFDDTLSQALVQHSAPELEIDRALELSLDRALDIASNPDFEITLKFANTRSLDLHFTHVLDSEATSDLKAALQKLKDELPILKDTESFKLWWTKNSLSWIQKLREIMKNRNIGSDWQLNRQDKKLLEQYSDANKLLVDCLNIDSKEISQVRKEIEERLLLPFDEKEKPQQ
jgi:predicted NACHT family NTPase